MKDNAVIIAFIGLVTLAFGWVILPFLGAVFWAVVISIVFYPLYLKLLMRLSDRSNLASFAMVVLVLLIVIIPLLLIILSIVREATSLVATMQSDETTLQSLPDRMIASLPAWLTSVLARVGLTDFAPLQASVPDEISGWVSDIASQVFYIGQSTVNFFVSLFVMLYLTFFLFRDGATLTDKIKSVLPVSAELKDSLFARFTLVVRATVKGDILVAMLQGGLGGLGFWVLGVPAAILWTVLMSFLALLPVFGAGLVWVPFVIYFLSSGAIWQGMTLLLYGAIVISLVDNFVRPRLIGKATKMPEFVVLISTLGGVATFGLQGFITGPVIAALFISVWTTVTFDEKSSTPQRE